jgi:hypothetical protein
VSAVLAAALGLQLSFGAVIPCAAPPGTAVASITPVGGNKKPVVLRLTEGDVADFAISGDSIVVGPAGISPDNCGTSQTLQVTAKQ